MSDIIAKAKSTDTNDDNALGKLMRSRRLAMGSSKIDINTDKYNGTNMACPSIKIKITSTNDNNCIQSRIL
jgi:hypothetical protein